MGRRVEWLKLVTRHRRLRDRLRQALLVSSLLAFEAYYVLCRLRGYPARHFLDPSPAVLGGLVAGDKYIVHWPPLPPSIRLLDRVFYQIGHAEFTPYTPEAAERIKASGRRMKILAVEWGELRAALSR